MREASRLSEATDLDQHTLSLPQNGRVELGRISLAVGVLGVLGGALSVAAAVAGVLISLAAVAVLLWEWLQPQALSLSVSQRQLRVRGQQGLLAIAQEHHLPLAGLEVSVRAGPVWFGRPSWHLLLTPANEHARVLHGLLGTEADLERVVAVLSAAAQRASDRQGGGQKEIPAALQRMGRPERT